MEAEIRKGGKKKGDSGEKEAEEEVQEGTPETKGRN